MAMDSAAKRYSAIHPSSPWRGAAIVPDAAFPQGERQAAAFLYSGILAASVVITDKIRDLITSFGMIAFKR